MPGLRRSIWITAPNVLRLKDISKILRLDNDNLVINTIIEDYMNYLSNKKSFELIELLKKEFQATIKPSHRQS